MRDSVNGIAIAALDLSRPLLHELAVEQYVLPPGQQVSIDARPGPIRHVAIGHQPDPIVGANGKERVLLRIVAFVEVNPSQARVRREFLVLSPGLTFESRSDVQTEFCGIALDSESGAAVYVYELVQNIVEAGAAEATPPP